MGKLDEEEMQALIPNNRNLNKKKGKKMQKSKEKWRSIKLVVNSRRDQTS